MAVAMVVIRAVTMAVVGQALVTFKRVHGEEADVRRIMADPQVVGTLRDTK